MVLNAIFNNISVISWQSVLFVEETGITTIQSPTQRPENRNNKKKSPI